MARICKTFAKKVWVCTLEITQNSLFWLMSNGACDLRSLKSPALQLDGHQGSGSHAVVDLLFKNLDDGVTRETCGGMEGLMLILGKSKKKRLL